MDTCGTGLGGFLQTQKHKITLWESIPDTPDITAQGCEQDIEGEKPVNKGPEQNTDFWEDPQ